MTLETILVPGRWERKHEDKGSVERRRESRIAIPLRCRFDWRDYSVRGRTVDISAGGALIEARVIPREGEVVYLTFRGLSGEAPLLGMALRAAWFCDGPNLGLGRAALRFDRLTEIDRKCFARFLAWKE